MRKSSVKVGDYIVLSNHAPKETQTLCGQGPFRIDKIGAREVQLCGSHPFTITCSQLSAFFEKCPLRLVA